MVPPRLTRCSLGSLSERMVPPQGTGYGATPIMSMLERLSSWRTYRRFVRLLRRLLLVAPRAYPRLPPSIDQPQRPLSFVVVRFSDDYLHNFLKSECLKNPINEQVIVDNTGNLYYDNLTEAMAAGVSKTSHKLVAVVHEDCPSAGGLAIAL